MSRILCVEYEPGKTLYLYQTRASDGRLITLNVGKVTLREARRFQLEKDAEMFAEELMRLVHNDR